MIRGYTENGSQWVGFVRGALWERLKAGEAVELPGHVDGNGAVYSPLRLRDMPREMVEALERGERVCLPGTPRSPHWCFFLRDTNAELIRACDAYFPGGRLPGAPFEHVSEEEPT